MDTVLLKDNIKDKEINDFSYKVRAVLINSKNEIIITKYAGIYMFPGGKLDIKEDECKALKRELKEELGISINLLNKPLIIIEQIIKDYPKKDNKTLVNRYSKTSYYFIKTNTDINFYKRKLSNNEKNGKFEILKVKYSDLEKLLYRFDDNIPNSKYYKKEFKIILEILKEKHI